MSNANVSMSIGHTPNYATVRVGAIALHFSYETVIAFVSPWDSAVRENDWGPTTGKHINAIDGGDKTAKSRRISGPEFESRLAAVVARIGVAS